MKGKMNAIDLQLMNEQQEKIDSTIASFLLLIITIVPLLTRTVLLEHDSPLITSSLMDTGIKGDVFTYYKFIFLLIGCAGLVIFFAYKMTIGHYSLLPNYGHIPLAMMMVAVVFSALFADYKTLSVFGGYNRHDGALTYLGYFILFFGAATIIFPEQKMKAIFTSLYIVISVNAVLGLLYFYGVDVLKSDLIHGILFPSSLPPEAINAGAHLDSTINNPNYVSGISSVFVLLLVTKASLEESVRQKVLPLLFAALSFAMLLCSLSTSGFFTCAVMIPVLCVLLFLGKRKQAFATLVVALLLFSGVFGVLYHHNPRVWNESIGFFLGKSTTKVMDQEQGKQLQTAVKKAASDLSPLAAGVAYAAETPAPQKSEFDLPKPGWGPGTGRVYIWTNTLALIKHHPLFGYGLDTLPYYFPQGDINKIANLNDANTIVDKPHNLYLAIAFGSGMITLLAFLFLIVRHLWEHIKCFKKRIVSSRQVVIASLFAGWAAYLIQALLNDSVIGSSVIFWTLFGIGVSLVRQETSEATN